VKKNKLKLVTGTVIGSMLVGIVVFSLVTPIFYSTPKKNKNTPDVLFEGMVLRNFDHGKLVFILKSNKAVMFRKENKAILSNVSGEFFSNNNRVFEMESPSLDIALDSLIISMKQVEGNWLVKGGLVHMSAQRLTWDPDKKVIEAMGDVNLTNDRMHVVSKTVVYKMSDSQLWCKGDPNNVVIQQPSDTD
jgi:hypothetical protein